MPGVECHRGCTFGIAGPAEPDQLLVAIERRAPVERCEPQPLGPAQHRRELVEHRDQRRVAADGHGHAVEVVVGAKRGVHVTGIDGSDEPVIRIAHGVEVRRGEVGDRFAHREFVHGGDHVARIQDGTPLEGAHDRRATRLGDDQAAVRQSEQRLAHGGAAHAQPFGEFPVLELLTWSERAVDDGVADADEDVIAQEGSTSDRRVLRNGHAIYCARETCIRQASHAGEVE